MTRTAPTESATVTTAWHITIDDPILLALHGWRAARAAPDTAELLGYRPPTPACPRTWRSRCSSRAPQRGSVSVPATTGCASRRPVHGFRGPAQTVTAQLVAARPSGARQCVLDGQAVAVAVELVDARLAGLVGQRELTHRLTHHEPPAGAGLPNISPAPAGPLPRPSRRTPP